LAGRDKRSNTQVLLIGALRTDQLQWRWLAGLEPQVLTLRGYAARGRSWSPPSATTSSFACRARQDDVAVRLKLPATLLSPPDGVHPVAEVELPVHESLTRRTVSLAAHIIRRSDALHD
jgi:hypothetical protein